MRTLFIEHREEINKIIGECKTCYLAMSDGGLPYVLPMNFALDGYSIILHSAQSGRMWETIKRNPNVYKKLAKEAFGYTYDGEYVRDDKGKVVNNPDTGKPMTKEDLEKTKKYAQTFNTLGKREFGSLSLNNSYNKNTGESYINANYRFYTSLGAFSDSTQNQFFGHSFFSLMLS